MSSGLGLPTTQPPRVYRAMRRDPSDGLPVVGSAGSSELGARPGYDITVDGAGIAVLDATGMSVAPGWRDLPFTRIPRRLRHLVPGASGSNSTACYALGAGPFQRGSVADGLELFPDPEPPPVTHGVIAPVAVVPVDRFQADLENTRAAWQIGGVTMEHPNRLGSPSFHLVAKGLVDLHRLIAAGKEDSPEAESVRDALDTPLSILNRAEKERAQWLSEDLYSISDPPSTDRREMDAGAQQQYNEAIEALQGGEWDRSLALLRRCQERIAPALLSYLRGRIWSKAGHPVVASMFHGHAAQSEPTRANYRAIYLAVLAEVDPEEASRLAGEVLADDGNYAPIVVSRAAMIRFHEAGDAATSESVRLLRNLIPILERNLGRIEQDEGTPSRSGALHTSLGLLGLCQERLGNAGAAVHYYSLGLQAKPEDDSLLVARGILLYGSDPRALADFEQAVNLGSPLVWPYLFLAHHFLVSQQYDRCLFACEAGSKKQGSNAAKSQIQELMAISRAELGFPPEFVRAAFEEALRLDPSNELARQNLAAFEASPGGQQPIRSRAWHRRSAMLLRQFGMAEQRAAA